jgi:hypothetical protein
MTENTIKQKSQPEKGWQPINFEARLSTKELFLLGPLSFCPKRFLFETPDRLGGFRKIFSLFNYNVTRFPCKRNKI